MRESSAILRRMNYASSLKPFAAAILLGIGIRLCLLMGEANPKGWELAAYYVGFFWTASLVRRPGFRQGFLPRSLLLPVAILLFQVAMISLSYFHGRALAFDLKAFGKSFANNKKAGITDTRRARIAHQCHHFSFFQPVY